MKIKNLMIAGLLVCGMFFLAGCNKTPEVEAVTVPAIEEVIEVVKEETVIEKVKYNFVKEVKTPKTLRVSAIFKQDFVDKYMYEDSTTYRFAINVDGNYYNVFRNDAGWVSNSIKDWLTWAVPANMFNGKVYTWEIPLNTQLNVARKGKYGYEHKTLEIKDSYDVKISPVKEGVETHHVRYKFGY